MNLSFSDVPRDFRSPYNGSCRVTKGGNSDRYGQHPAVFGLALRLMVIDALPARQPGQDIRKLIDPFRHSQRRDIPADDFPGRVAENALGAAIPAADDAVHVLIRR